jgi:D-tagatose-1,6-bisphosphate aldolase subunit GatZ/KbaZ
MVLDEIIAAQKRGEIRGIPSICSAHPTVLCASLRQALENHDPVLIESTCNQVNQYGGYTGMTPVDFVSFIGEIADRLNFPRECLILGGDHLGPGIWQDENSEGAMDKARRLVWGYVGAGYLKIHLDASMKLGDDPEGRLSKEVAASRSADLAQAAEDAYIKRGFGGAPRYVIGTEVPVPGGTREVEDHVQMTEVADAADTLEITRKAFYSRDLESAWDRVIAMVVQPGVEYGNDFILEYDRTTAASLSKFIENEALVYEAHSTDYQTQEALRQMVADHFAILKVGPALTYAYREAVYALAMMEAALFPTGARSNLIEVLDQAMLGNPAHWRKYYPGDSIAQSFARQYSFSDRSRYYWTAPEVQAALEKLTQNLSSKPLPLSLISQFAPEQYKRIRRGQLANQPDEIVFDRIMDVLHDYRMATQP